MAENSLDRSFPWLAAGISDWLRCAGEIVPAEDGLLELVTEQGGRNVREHFHRIVLSIGQRPAADTSNVCALTGLKTDEFGFLSPKGSLDSSRTGVTGIYLAGSCSGPKDIEETLVMPDRQRPL